MNDLAADILARVQGAPGRWTVDELAAATGKTRDRVTVTIAKLCKAGLIERPAPIDYFDPAPGWRTVTFQPTGKAWVVPAARPRT